MVSQSHLNTNETQHGGGTNSTIFNVQSIRIQRPLSKHFDFIFVDAPFPSKAGPGVLPVFDGCEPYLSWLGKDKALLPDESLLNIETALKGREADVVGVMGFSQGGKLGAGLLLMQQLRSSSFKDKEYPINFRFGVMCMSVCPPLLTEKYRALGRSEEKITIPSVHVVGTEDEWYDDGIKLFDEHFDHKRSSIMEFDIGHRLPVEEDQTGRIVSAIRRLYEETTGKRLDL